MTLTNHCKLRQAQLHVSDSMIKLTLYCGQKIKHSDKVVLKRDQVDELYEGLFNLLKQLESN